MLKIDWSTFQRTDGNEICIDCVYKNGSYTKCSIKINGLMTSCPNYYPDTPKMKFIIDNQTGEKE
jgi:hypothetical protein